MSKISSKWGSKIRSAVSITERGRLFVANYVAPLEDALSDGLWLERMGHEYFSLLVTSPERFTEIAQNAATNYSKVSSHINERDSELSKDIILTSLAKRGSLTTAQIAQEIKKSKGTARKYANQLLESGCLTYNVNEDNEKVYSLNSQSKHN